ncbi:MAG: alpha/beta fold hydrolase [Chloroflexales bacterium]|nr:alpha/beta fold hydrolase [Chloroflexales bacterium]
MIDSIDVQVKGYRLHALSAGAGSPVLLLHGFAGSAEDWCPTVELLSRNGYRAIAIDALGFGKSDKPAEPCYSLHLAAELYTGLLDALGLDQAALVAHSMGGKNALATTILHPDRISRLLLADSDGFVQIPLMMRKGGSLPLLGRFFLWMAARPAVIRAQLQEAFFDPQAYVTPEIITRGVEVLGNLENRRALLALSRSYDATDLSLTGLRARLGDIRCPTLIVWGAEDRIFAASHGETAQREIPDARLVLIPRCGHFPQIEAFQEFHGLLLGFLAAGKAVELKR